MGKTSLTFILIALQVYQVNLETILQQFYKFAYEIVTAMNGSVSLSTTMEWTADTKTLTMHGIYRSKS